MYVSHVRLLVSINHIESGCLSLSRRKQKMSFIGKLGNFSCSNKEVTLYLSSPCIKLQPAPPRSISTDPSDREPLSSVRSHETAPFFFCGYKKSQSHHQGARVDLNRPGPLSPQPCLRRRQRSHACPQP
jgi:hypothetical protein